MLPHTRRQFMTLLLIGLASVINANISNFKKCATEDCQTTISEARALMGYDGRSIHGDEFLSFKVGDKINVKSVSAGTRPDLWSGEVNGRTGYFPKSYVKEDFVHVKNPVHDIPTSPDHTEGGESDKSEENKDNVVDNHGKATGDSKDNAPDDVSSSAPAQTSPAPSESAVGDKLDKASSADESVTTGSEAKNTGDQSKKSGYQAAMARNLAEEALSKDQSKMTGDQTDKVGHQADKTGDRAEKSGGQSHMAGDQIDKVGDLTEKTGDQSHVAGDQSHVAGDQMDKTGDQAKMTGDPEGKVGDQAPNLKIEVNQPPEKKPEEAIPDVTPEQETASSEAKVDPPPETGVPEPHNLSVAPPGGDKNESEMTSPGEADTLSPEVGDDHAHDTPVQRKSPGPVASLFDPLTTVVLQYLPRDVQTLLEQEPIGLPPNYTILVVLVATLTSLLASCCCMLGGGKDDAFTKRLMARCDRLNKELVMATHEKESLEETLASMEKKTKTVEAKSTRSDAEYDKLRKEIQTSQLHNKALKKQVDDMEERSRSLEESLREQQSVVQDRDAELGMLRGQLTQIEQHSAEITAQLTQVHSLLQGKEMAVQQLEGQMTGLNEEVTILTQSKQELISQSLDWDQKLKDLTEANEKLKSESAEMMESLTLKDNEIEVMRECILKLKTIEAESTGDGDADHTDGNGDFILVGAEKKCAAEKISDMMNVARMNAILTQVEEDKVSLQQKLIVEVEDRKEMEDQIKKLHQQNDQLKTDQAKAQRECQEALTKLSVLSGYFKEKEMEMQKALGQQVVIAEQSSAELHDVGSKTRELQREVDMYKEQVEDLKKEIVNVERDYKTQLAANEKKAHENWLAARAAERELKESKLEMSQLRSKLNEVERQREMVPEGLLRPLPTRPPLMNGPPPPGPPLGPPPCPPGPPPHPGTPERPGSRPSPHMRDLHQSPPLFDGLPPPHPMDRRPPMMPPGPPPPFMDRPPLGPPPFDWRGPPDRTPPPADRRPSSEEPYDRHTPPERRYTDRRTPPYRPGDKPPRGGPPPPHYRGPPPHDRGPPPQHRSTPSDHNQSRDKIDSSPSPRKV